jgi:hypothetical protein
MIEKLSYLQNLKNSMGEEMAEMMSEEITKVMDEQKYLEEQYAALIIQRGQLKGISNKAKLTEVKKEIEVSFNNTLTLSQKIANELKLSTVKLVRQLHENPDVAGNDKMIEKHKSNLIELITSVMEEKEKQLKFEAFETYIRTQLEE